MTVRVLGWVARRLWPPVVVVAAVGIQHTADMYARTDDPVFTGLRAAIAIAAVAAGVSAVYTTRSTR